MKTSNPALSDRALNDFYGGHFDQTIPVMTIGGTVLKAFFYLAILFVSAVWVWNKTLIELPTWNPEAKTSLDQVSVPNSVYGYIVGGALVGFLIGIFNIITCRWSDYLAPIYAFCEGLVLGGLSAAMEYVYPGCVLPSVLVTFCILGAMLGFYYFRILRATPFLWKFLMVSMAGIVIYYFVDIIVGFWGQRVPLLHETGPLGICLSLFVVGIASFNLILDFDQIEECQKCSAPKYMESYLAFSLLVTLVWIYLEVLKLVSKLKSKD